MSNLTPEQSPLGKTSAYADRYAATYGVEEPVTTLIPAMLAAFLDADRDFVRAERSRQT